MLIYRSPAKINLSLDILRVRPDGYHELQSVVHCIGLYDVLKFEFLCDENPLLQFHCNDVNLETDDNLCLRAVREYVKAWETHSGLRGWSGVRITLRKNIPMGAGLGGGSGNAATTLRALAERFEHSLDETQIHRVATKLGADVPLFLKGGCVLMEGIGEKLSVLPALEGAVVIVVPDQHASTPEVYRRFDEINEPSRASTPALLETMGAGNISTVAHSVGNDLQRAAQSLGIDVELPIHLLKKYGAMGAQMSGSGAASFGLFRNHAAAQHAVENMRGDGSLPENYKVFVAPLVVGGVGKIESESPPRFME
jgi:4-diphosphocytidyl-2-C-methyl-D-erythritol kinase